MFGEGKHNYTISGQSNNYIELKAGRAFGVHELFGNHKKTIKQIYLGMACALFASVEAFVTAG